MTSEARLKFLKKMIILGPKTAILGPQFCKILVLGPHFWWSGGDPGPQGPPGSAPATQPINRESGCKIWTVPVRAPVSIIGAVSYPDFYSCFLQMSKKACSLPGYSNIKKIGLGQDAFRTQPAKGTKDLLVSLFVLNVIGFILKTKLLFS